MNIYNAAKIINNANGHLSLHIDGPNPFDLIRLWWRLKVKHGFHREGKLIIGAGESISPNYVKGALALTAGHDDMMGYYISSDSKEGDRFLSEFIEELA